MASKKRKVLEGDPIVVRIEGVCQHHYNEVIYSGIVVATAGWLIDAGCGVFEISRGNRYNFGINEVIFHKQVSDIYEYNGKIRPKVFECAQKRGYFWELRFKLQNQTKSS